MPYYVLCGKPDCPAFVHAIHVAQYLNKYLPSFEYKKIDKTSTEWGPYIYSLNKKHKWHITESPLIWKELSRWGGKKYLIGGLSEFWEYVYCYYGLESLIPKSEIAKLAEDNRKFYELKEVDTVNMRNKQKENQTTISVFGVCKQTPILVSELLGLESMQKTQLIIKLFDLLGQRDNTRRNILDRCMFDESVSIAPTVESALDDCDIVIYMNDLSQKPEESNYEWLSRVYFRIQLFAETINECGKRNLKVICNCHGPSCFMASILLEYCTKLRPYNIVVVSSDEGLSMLSIISEKTGIKIAKLGAPPVWGFIGINTFVDEKYILFKGTTYKPYKRALTAPQGTTLPLGTMKCELRLMSYMLTEIDHDDLVKEITTRRQMVREKTEWPMGLSKIRALVNLLEHWFADVHSDNIISLGIYSDGSFGIPSGMVFSQPVKLDETGRWVPYSGFPLMNNYTLEQVSKCAIEAKEICQNFIIPATEYGIEYEDGTYDGDGDWTVTFLESVDEGDTP